MRKIVSVIQRCVAWICIVLMAVIVIDVTWQVVSRFILKHPSSFTEELAGFLLIWIGLLGASHAYYTRAHLGIDILTEHLHGLKRVIVEGVVQLVVALFAFFVMIVGGIRLVRLTLALGQISPALGIPMGYVYGVVPLSGALILLYALVFLIEVVRSASRHSDASHSASPFA